MVAIPPAKDTDVEDVAWGLQTAEALWKRGERIDAIVWLRRAAQSAGEVPDDDRALELARAAAELTDWMATLPPGSSNMPPAPSVPPAAAAPVAPAHQPVPSYDPHNASTFVPYGEDDQRPPVPAPAPAPAGPASANAAPTYVPQGPPTYVPEDGRVSIEVDLENAENARGRLPAFTAEQAPRPAPPIGRPPSSPTVQTAEPHFPEPAPRAEHESPSPMPPPATPESPEAPEPEAPEAPPPEPEKEQQRQSSTSVLPAERVHAGMFNPWDDNALPAAPALPLPSSLPPRFAADEEEVITSVRPQQLAQQRAEALALANAPAPAPAPGAPPEAARSPRAADAEAPRPAPLKPPLPRPPPLPPRARKPTAPAPLAVPPAPITAPLGALEPTAAPAPAPAETPAENGATPDPAQVVATSSRPVMTPPPPSPTQVMARSEVPPHPTTEPELAAATPASEPPAPPPSAPPPSAPPPPLAPPPPAPAPAARASSPKLDLDEVEAFADLPDDAREAFAAAAEVSSLGEGEEVSSFALAYILSGTVDVAATMVDAPAARLAAGAVLRSRGTTDDGVPMRLIGVSSGVVATWTDAAVQDAFRTCPWVEEDLRTAADRLQTLVGVTIGPLGERLDASIREQIIERLTMRTLSPGEVVVTAGQPVPGLLLVGVGQLEVVDGERVAGVVGSGEFLFPGEVLGAGAAPLTARAGAGGALILFGDRMIAQELLVTCPPLLEVFAGM